MREIKFRAWDKINKEMCMVKKILDFKDSMHLILDSPNADIWGNNYGANTNFVELMQFAGVYDRSGREVYEGDILDCTSELVNMFDSRPTGKYSTTLYEVVWIKDSWGTKCLSSKTIVVGSISRGLSITASYSKVIGNIYENPEMLEGAGHV